MRWVLALCALAGCGSDVISCVAPSVGCIEVSDPPSGYTAQFEQQCTQGMGTVQDHSCDRKGVLGGCREAFPGVSFVITTWYLPTAAVKTVDDVKAQCTMAHEMFVAP